MGRAAASSLRRSIARTRPALPGDGAQDVPGELERAGGRGDDGRRPVGGADIAGDGRGDGGVGVDDDPGLLVDRLDFGEDPGLVGPAGDDERVDFFFVSASISNRPVRKRSRNQGLIFRVPAGDFEQEPFQVGGDQDVHRGRRRPEKFAVSVVDAGLEKSVRMLFSLEAQKNLRTEDPWPGHTRRPGCCRSCRSGRRCRPRRPF